MKLKEFKKTEVFKMADVVEYLDDDGVEIELPKNEVQRRKFDNREVIDHGTLIGNGLATLEVYLK